MVQVKLPKMNEEEISRLIESKNLCRIAFIEGDYPYVSPFQYVTINGQLYFHFTNYGKKKEILRKNRNVCVSIENFIENLSEYQFVSIQGRLQEVTDNQQKRIILKKLMEDAKDKYSKKFLAVHGFKVEEDWSKLTKDPSLRIFRLQEKKERIGLRSLQ